jgi:hypothetical protein
MNTNHTHENGDPIGQAILDYSLSLFFIVIETTETTKMPKAEVTKKGNFYIPLPKQSCGISD